VKPFPIQESEEADFAFNPPPKEEFTDAVPMTAAK
jgi:hypothetical protein